MDAIGVEKAVLPLSGPGVQAEIVTEVAVRKAKECNDFLAERIAENPTRYGCFAHLDARHLRGSEADRLADDEGVNGPPMPSSPAIAASPSRVLPRARFCLIVLGMNTEL